MDQARLTDEATLHDAASFLAKRVITQVVGDATNKLCLSGEVNESAALTRIHSQRLFAYDVLAGFHHTFRLVMMSVVGRADVDDIDLGVAHEFVDRVIPAFELQLADSFVRTLGRAA